MHKALSRITILRGFPWLVGIICLNAAFHSSDFGKRSLSLGFRRNTLSYASKVILQFYRYRFVIHSFTEKFLAEAFRHRFAQTFPVFGIPSTPITILEPIKISFSNYWYEWTAAMSIDQWNASSWSFHKPASLRNIFVRLFGEFSSASSENSNVSGVPFSAFCQAQRRKASASFVISNLSPATNCTLGLSESNELWHVSSRVWSLLCAGFTCLTLFLRFAWGRMNEWNNN